MDGSDLTVFGVEVGHHIWWIGLLFLLYQLFIYAGSAYLEFEYWRGRNHLQGDILLIFLGRKFQRKKEADPAITEVGSIKRDSSRAQVRVKELNPDGSTKGTRGPSFPISDFKAMQFSFWRFLIFDALVTGVLSISAIAVAGREIAWYFFDI